MHCFVEFLTAFCVTFLSLFGAWRTIGRLKNLVQGRSSRGLGNVLKEEVHMGSEGRLYSSKSTNGGKGLKKPTHGRVLISLTCLGP